MRDALLAERRQQFIAAGDLHAINVASPRRAVAVENSPELDAIGLQEAIEQHAGMAAGAEEDGERRTGRERERGRQGDRETRRQGDGTAAGRLSLSPCLNVSLSFSLEVMEALAQQPVPKRHFLQAGDDRLRRCAVTEWVDQICKAGAEVRMDGAANSLGDGGAVVADVDDIGRPA